MAGTAWLSTVSVVLTLAVTSGADAEDSPIRWGRVKYYMPWAKGPNMCAVQEVAATRKQFYDECMLYKPRTICGNPTTMKYMCCNGYEKINENDKGCKGVVPLDNLYNTLDTVQLTEMQKVAKRTGLDASLINDGTFTLFAPDNRAIRNLPAETRKKLLQRVGDKTKPSLVLTHVVRGKHSSRSLQNDDRLNSLFSDKADIRINRFTSGIVTANCARVTRPNQEATNGVIHTIDRMLEPLSEKNTIFDELVTDRRNRFGEFVTSLILTGAGEDLQDERGMYTVFAPTDAAFRRLPPKLLERIIRRKDNEALKTLLRYHIIPRPICSAAILDQGALTTLEGSKLNLACSGNDRVSVNGVPLSDPDMLATNGVIHAIDEVLIPESVRSMEEVAVEMKLNQFVNYAQRAGLGKIMDGTLNTTFTLFAPNDQAFQELKPEQQRYLSDPSSLQRVMKYHIVPGSVATSTMIDQEKKESILGVTEFQTESSLFGDKGQSVRFIVDRKNYGFCSAKIVSADHVARRGMIQVINKVIIPPEESLIEIIKSRADLSSFYGLLQSPDSKFEKLLDAAGSKMTLFVPNNEAFRDIDAAALDALKKDRKSLSKVVKCHIVNKNVYSNSIAKGLRFRFRTKGGEWLDMTRDRSNDAIKLNDKAVMKEADILATNGVIQVIDAFLRKPNDVTSS